jgi:hypothetical protein
MTVGVADRPVAFANHVWSDLHRLDESLAVYAPREAAALGAALDRVRGAAAEVPGLAPLLSKVDDAANDYAGAAHADGIRFGVAAEQLRAALVRAREVQHAGRDDDLPG